MGEDVVRDLRGNPLALVPCEPCLFRKVGLDVGRHSLAEGVRVHADVEELRAELTDDREVDPVLDLGEGVPPDRDRRRANRGEPLMEFHQCFLPIRRTRRLPLLEGPIGAS